MTRELIAGAHPDTRFIQTDCDNIYVADFTERTQTLPEKRSVEVSGKPQISPDGSGEMDSAHFMNPARLAIEFALFHDSEYTDQSGANRKHCEGAMYLQDTPNPLWAAFLELKDCRPKRIRHHAFKARRQIFNVVKDFRQRGILDGSEKLYGIVSCPRRKIAFNNLIAGDTITATRLKKYTGILYYGSNEILILSRQLLQPKI